MCMRVQGRGVCTCGWTGEQRWVGGVEGVVEVKRCDELRQSRCNRRCQSLTAKEIETQREDGVGKRWFGCKDKEIYDTHCVGLLYGPRLKLIDEGMKSLLAST